MLKKPTLLSKPLPDITSIIISLTCSGIMFFTKLDTKSIEIFMLEANNTTIVRSGIIARII